MRVNIGNWISFSREADLNVVDIVVGIRLALDVPTLAFDVNSQIVACRRVGLGIDAEAPITNFVPTVTKVELENSIGKQIDNVIFKTSA